MDTELLRAFIAVAECEGFSTAGKVLNRSQSTVSLQIKRLEQSLGGALFKHTSRSVQLTDAGRRIMPYARPILSLQDEAEHLLGAEPPGELIRLGISEEQASAYLPELLPAFALQHPDVRLEVTCDISSNLVARFQEGLLDAALAVRHAPTRTGRLLGREPMVWVMRKGCSFDQWDKLPLALNPDGCIFRAHALAALSRARLRWNLCYTSPSPTGVNVAVQSGLALTVKTPRSVPAGCRAVEAAEGLPALGHVDVELHRAPGRTTEAFESFCARLTEVVTQSQTLDTFGDHT